MATPVIMPRQGQSVESCIITAWHKKKGDKIKKGDILFSYETDKASFEKEAEDEGVLLEIFFNEGDDVPVLVNVAVIGQPGEPADGFRTPGTTPVTPEKKEEKNEPAASTVQPDIHDAPTHLSDEILVSPRAKALAAKLGVPLMHVRGTGPQGRIIEDDIKNYAATSGIMTKLAGVIASETGLTPPSQGTGIGGRVLSSELSLHAASGDSETKKLSNIRRIIATNMLKSLQSSAQLTHHLSADARNILALREKIKPQAEQGVLPNITINDMVCFALIRALLKHPDANGHFLGDSIRLFRHVHLGFAVDTPRGLMVPVLQNADTLTLPQLSLKLKELAQQCKEGKIDPGLLSSETGSFTISNLGNYGIEMFTPVLNIPQIGILGVNTISHKPKDIGQGTVAFVPHIGLSLTYDHRALDGAPASVFLRDIRNEIESLNIEL